MHLLAPTLLVACVLSGPPEPLAAAHGTEPRLEHCLVSLMSDVQVSSQEPGLLTKLLVSEGDPVDPSKPLAQLDDRQVSFEYAAAYAQNKAAQEKADDDIDVRFSTAAYEVAAAELQEKRLAKAAADAYSTAEIRRLELTVKKARLQIDRSQMELRVAKLNADVEAKRLDASAEAIRRRKVYSLTPGVVLQVYRHPGEWVQPGDPILRVIRMDRLWVEGFVDGGKHNPEEVAGRSATVSIERARGEVRELPGRVVYVNPQTQAGNQYRVKVEVANEQVGDDYLLRPGMRASVTIHVRRPRPDAAGLPAQAQRSRLSR